MRTGDWEQGRLRDAAAPGDDVADSDEGMLSDFEDMEIGLKFGADGDRATAAAIKAIQAEEHVRVEEKTAKKAAFDTEYDVGKRDQQPVLWSLGTAASTGFDA